MLTITFGGHDGLGFSRLHAGEHRVRVVALVPHHRPNFGGQRLGQALKVLAIGLLSTRQMHVRGFTQRVYGRVYLRRQPAPAAP